MRVVRINVGPLAAASANNICLSQTPSGAGNLVINGALASGGVATLDIARRVLFTFAGNETSKTFVVYGTDRNGNSITESLAGVNATTTYTARDFKTVTQISISAAAAGAMTVGTNGIASSEPVVLDTNGPPQISLQAAVSGTINYTLQQTLDDPFNLSASTVWFPHGDPTVVNATTSQQSEYAYVPTMTRVLINSGTGSLVYSVAQPGPGYK